MTDELQQLQSWYLAQCDSDWEHSYGVSIDTLDNPGWSLKIDLRGTPLEDLAFEPVVIERNDNDWVNCRLEEMKFMGFGGPRNLGELIRTYLEWAQKHGCTSA